MVKEKALKNKIAYWLKHQELDKFNFNSVSIMFPSLIAILSAVFIPTMIYFAQKELTLNLIKISVTYLIASFSLLTFMLISRYNYNRSFRIREAMLRVLYNNLFEKKRGKIMTDELDEQFIEIKKGYKQNMANKEIENIAERVMKGEINKQKLIPDLDKRTLAISIAGGFVSGGCLLSYQILLNKGWNPLPSGIVAIIVAVIIYKMALSKIDKKESS